jgi:hypothetical protein
MPPEAGRLAQATMSALVRRLPWPMTTWRAFWEGVHLCVLGLWAGVLVGVGVCAAVVFPTLKGVGVRLPEYSSDPSGHYRIAAGMVAQKVFLVGDFLMFPLSLVAAVTLGILIVVYRVSSVRAAMMVRGIGLSFAIAALAALLLVVTPQINAASQRHWAAARIGDASAAAPHIKAVDDLHPIATLLMSIEFIGVVIALGAAAWSHTMRAPLPDTSASSGKLPEPALLKANRGRRL